jgi:predicted enzyme related to lactoylglutathione lyase
MNLEGILIGSDDPKTLAEYYSKLFGSPVMEDGDYRSWQIGTGWLTVGAHDEVKGKNEAPGRIIWNIAVDDVRAEFERLRSVGATVVREPYTLEGPDPDGPEMTIATLCDPDDNYFQLMTAMEM